MSGVSIFDLAFGATGAAATALGELLALDPADAAARNARICELTARRRDRRLAGEAAREQELSEREGLPPPPGGGRGRWGRGAAGGGGARPPRRYPPRRRGGRRAAPRRDRA